jgi:hypothetical protein
MSLDLIIYQDPLEEADNNNEKMVNRFICNGYSSIR